MKLIRVKAIRVQRIRRKKFTPAETVRLCVAVAVLVILTAPLFATAARIPRGIAVAVALAGLGFTFSDVRRDFLRSRPRQRARTGALSCGVLAGVFGIMAAAMFADGEQRGTVCFVAFALLALAGGVWLFLRWRRLRAEAEIRLWQLRQRRRARNV